MTPLTIWQNLREGSSIDPSLVEDVCVGNVLSDGSAYLARSAVLAAGFPVTASASVSNRFCSSGLLAIQNVANQIIAGSIDVGIAVGAESMSTSPDKGAPDLGEKVNSHEIAKQNNMPMGQTSENVAGQFQISRQRMDEFAANSFQKAEKAQKAGLFEDEIAPVKTSVVDPKTKERKEVVVDKDDGIRYGTTAQSLGKVRQAFPQWAPSNTTGGNASQITDGAAALLLMKRSRAEQLGQPILAKFVGATVAGLEPRIMGIGPTLAIPKILSKYNLQIGDIDIVEINEAFASMVCGSSSHSEPFLIVCRACTVLKSWNWILPKSTLEVEQCKYLRRIHLTILTVYRAFGHPLGCTGARQVVTVLSELRKRKEKIAVTSMCVGTGMGMAGIFVSEQ